MEHSHIYILSAGADVYKVGLTADDVQKRAKSLSTGSAHRLTVEAVFDVPKSIASACERAAHCALADSASVDSGGREFFQAQSLEDLRARVEAAIKQVCELHSSAVQALQDLPSGVDVVDIEKSPAQDRICELLARRKHLDREIGRLGLEKSLIEREILARCQGKLCLGPKPLLEWKAFSQKRVDLLQLRRDFAETAQAVTRDVVCRRPVWY
jgi:hypothetical protein